MTKSGTNQLRGSLYTFPQRNAAGQQGQRQRRSGRSGPQLHPVGLLLSGPLVRDKLFFFVNAELERTDDPGTNFAASTGAPGFGISRVERRSWKRSASGWSRLQLRPRAVPGLRQRDQQQQGPRQARLEHQLEQQSVVPVQLPRRQTGPASPPLRAELQQHGRGPNETSLPFQNSGYAINNDLHSFALELNSRSAPSPTGSSPATTGSGTSGSRSATLSPPSRSARAG